MKDTLKGLILRIILKDTFFTDTNNNYFKPVDIRYCYASVTDRNERSILVNIKRVTTYYEASRKGENS